MVGVWYTPETFSVSVDGQLADSTSWHDVLIFNQEGTYSYEKNPEKKVLVYNVSGKTKTLSVYSYCEGTYSYDDETRELSLHPETVIDNRIENGIVSPENSKLVINLFGREGAYKIDFVKAGDVIDRIIVKFAGSTFGTPFWPVDSTPSSFQSRSTYVVNESGQVEYKIE